MMPVIFSWLLSGWLFTTGSACPYHCNEREFSVWKGGDEVGTLTVRRLEADSRATYTLVSQVDLNLVFNISVKESIKDVFENGRLAQSHHARYVNSSQKIKHTLEKTDSAYRIVEDDATVSHLDEAITASVVSLYFHEPSGDQRVYSQNFQQQVWMRKTGEHTFTIELPNGNVSTYVYRNGQVESVVSQTGWGQIKFTLHPGN